MGTSSVSRQVKALDNVVVCYEGTVVSPRNAGEQVVRAGASEQ